MTTEHSARSGQITVTTAGTAVPGADVSGEKFLLSPHPSNTGVVYVGNDGADDITSSNGFGLGYEASGNPILEVTVVRNLKELYFDAETNGDKICWFRCLD